MPTDRNPLFRKTMLPWYDSDAACFSVMVLMAVVLLFGISGMLAAREVPDYQGYTWVPLLLIMMSLGILISTVFRLAMRNIKRPSGLGT